MNTIHQFKVKSIEGGEIDFAGFAGKKVLIVNVASECGYTPQYAQLQELHETHGERIVVVGFPCNDFGGQEPGEAAQIREFCSLRYGVTFPLSEKISILGGNPHPIYRWLTEKTQNGLSDSRVSWNFQKYFLDEQGHLLGVFPSSCSVFDIPGMLD